MYTKADYFDGSGDPYGWNEADWQMNFRCEEVLNDLDQVLTWVDCERYGEGYDFLYDSGEIKAKTERAGYNNGDVDETDYQPTYIHPSWVDSEEMRIGEFPFFLRPLAEKWNEHYDVLTQLYDLLCKYAERVHWWTHYDDRTPKEQRLSDRYFALRDRFNAEIQKALDDVCGLANKYLHDDYQYFHSDEVAQEWADEKNYELTAQMVREEARRLLAGMTAAYENYAA